MTSLLTSVLEMLCMSGNVLSGIIAFNIWRIKEKTLFHKMFMVYFTFDSVIGAIDPYFLFKIFRERSGFLLLYYCDIYTKIFWAIPSAYLYFFVKLRVRVNFKVGVVMG